ncbi:MAG TPA: dihydroxyacetone kinase phosphoryl donor subunit DhaM [Chloroflexia bacterium]|nr:dihydroxyacetone kinase phosphoryl donor subunit DhaM [Chloroflexia bacterium]
MIGIVLVSHSQKLVEGLLELVTQLGGGRVPVAIAGGGPQGELGTSAEKIRDAILAVASQDGVLILADLGSAVLNSEMAIELLPSPPPGPIRLSSAPLVEGAIVAVLQAGLGQNLNEVLEAIEVARHFPKNLD